MLTTDAAMPAANVSGAPRPQRTRPAFASEAKRRAALELFESGRGYKWVATVLDLPAYTVRDWARAYRAGRFRVRIAEKQYRYTEEAKSRVLMLRGAGLSWKEIGERTGISISTCRSWVLAAEAAAIEARERARQDT